MSGYSLIQKIRRLEEQCDRLGFMMCHSKHGHYREFGDVVALKPKDENSLPIYSRDSELFTGTIDDLDVWLRGLEWARQYDQLLFGRKHQSNRERKEQDYRNQQLLSIIKNSEEEKK